MPRRLPVVLGFTALAAMAGGILPNRDRIRRVARRAARALERRRRYTAGRVQGWRYHRDHLEPTAEVVETVLADRVRSALGPLERRLDIPRVHVSVRGQSVDLHGEVPGEREEAEVVQAVRAVAGVRAVRTHLHLGLIRGDSRPSEGRRPAPSPAWRQLVEAARDGGAPYPDEAALAVLVAFVARLPDAQARQLLGHLPTDVRRRIRMGRRTRRRRPPRSARAFFDAVAEATGLPQPEAERVGRRILTSLHFLVPEENRGVDAVLPVELAELWRSTALHPA